MPEISVIIPTYNRPNYLRGTITSVLNQTFQDFEVIVVDDASSTNYAPEVVRSFGDSRIKTIRHPHNKGLSAARNTGIMMSKGKYIALLDDDDEWLPQKLELQYNSFKKSSPKIGIIYTGAIYVDRVTDKILEYSAPSKRGDISNELIKSDCVVSGGSSALIRKECFQEEGLFDENIPACEAYDMWIRLSKSFHFDYINQFLVKYYQHENRINTNFKLLISGIEAIQRKYYHFFSQSRKSSSNLYFNLGLLHCYDSNMEKGRRALFRSIVLYPFSFKYYFYLTMALAGAKNFLYLSNVKDNGAALIRNYKRLFISKLYEPGGAP